MPSTLSWLDTSEEEQKRVRELIALFTQSESRDELGIGQIRDAFSDGLFPGTSVIHTRARYFLFIPWLFQKGAKTRSGAGLAAWSDTQERKLIGALKDQGIGAGDGLIGRVAGPSVKTLPSTLYWSALKRYGILTHDVAPAMLGSGASSAQADGEVAIRSGNDWHPTLPPAPPGFPATVDGAMDLQPSEAQWLRERICDTAPGTMLAHLITDNTPLADDAAVPPWFDRTCLSAPSEPLAILQHARLFSQVMRGSALLYNLLVAERYEAEKLTTLPHPVDNYRKALSDWAGDLQADAALIRDWDLRELWNTVLGTNPRIGLQTRAFVDDWIDHIVSGQAATVADDPDARQSVGQRERRQKGAQSRLVNDTLLRTWSGASGTAPLVYRWPQIRRMVTDIREGLAGAGA